MKISLSPSFCDPRLHIFPVINQTDIMSEHMTKSSTLSFLIVLPLKNNSESAISKVIHTVIMTLGRDVCFGSSSANIKEKKRTNQSRGRAGERILLHFFPSINKSPQNHVV